jgi:hypothetical protein
VRQGHRLDLLGDFEVEHRLSDRDSLQRLLDPTLEIAVDPYPPSSHQKAGLPQGNRREPAPADGIVER